MLVYSIVVTFNGGKWINQCIGSLINSPIPNHRILCIDNASTDNTIEQIQESFSQVQIIETDANLGFGKANNIGLKIALEEGADYVFLLNQDAWVEPDTIEKLVKCHLLAPQYGILSPIHLNGKGEAPDYLFERFISLIYDDNQIHSFLNRDSDYKSAVQPAQFINAALWLIPRKTLETVGGFNPYFAHYGEDNDYVNRCHFHGFLIGFVPGAFGYHDRIQKESEEKRMLGRKRAFEVELSNPASRISRLTYMLKIGVRVIKYLMLLNISEVRQLRSLASYLKSNEKEIVYFRHLTRKKGPSFL